MKKFSVILLVLSLLLVLVACDKDKEGSALENQDNSQQNSSQIEDSQETPENPENPDTPEDPETSDTPENPETPETPETPEAPETPETPETPDEPETPAEPEPTPVPAPTGAFQGCLVQGDVCYRVTFTYENGSFTCGYGAGDNFDKFYADGEFEESKETVMEWEKDNLVEVNGVYYRFGRGGGSGPCTVLSCTNSAVSVRNEEGLECTVSYSYDGSKITVTGVTGAAEDMDVIAAAGMILTVQS